MMISLSRSLHYFIKIIVVIALAFGAMYLLGWLDTEGGQFWNTVLNTPKGWIVMAAIVVLSAIYPMMSFTTVSIRGDFDSERAVMDKVITTMGYEAVFNDADRTEYRAKSIFKRLFNQFDDRIIVSSNGNYITVSGLKKDVLRIGSLFAHSRLNNEQE